MAYAAAVSEFDVCREHKRLGLFFECLDRVGIQQVGEKYWKQDTNTTWWRTMRQSALEFDMLDDSMSRWRKTQEILVANLQQIKENQRRLKEFLEDVESVLPMRWN